MSKNDSLRPKSLVGIKRLAKAVVKEQNIPLCQAQDVIAQRVGYSNFIHAQKQLGNGSKAPAKAPRVTYRLTISAAWLDRNARQGGTEEWWVELSEHHSMLLSRVQMRSKGILSDLSLYGPDHFHFSHRSDSQEHARSKICNALRTFLFCDATKLRPSRARSRIHPRGEQANAIPGKDHYSSWFDPASKTYLMVDEPYASAAERNATRRELWAIEHQYEIVKPSWPGMYNPSKDSGSRLFLIAPRKHSALLSQISQALDKLPTEVTVEQWSGKSYQRTLPIPEKPKAAVPQSVSAPVVRMAINHHKEVGRKLQEVLAQTWRRDGVYNPVSQVTCTLDDWIQREYTSAELPMEVSGDIYYGSNTPRSNAKKLDEEQRNDCIQKLREVKTTLLNQYGATMIPTQSKLLDQAVKSLQNWS